MMMLQRISPHFVAAQLSPKSEHNKSTSPGISEENYHHIPPHKDSPRSMTPILSSHAHFEILANVKRRISQDSNEIDIKSHVEIEDEIYDRINCDAEEDDDVPLDLSINASEVRRNQHQDSGTESDDSGGPGEDRGPGTAAYKKSLMKRYCE